MEGNRIMQDEKPYCLTDTGCHKFSDMIEEFRMEDCEGIKLKAECSKYRK